MISDIQLLKKLNVKLSFVFLVVFMFRLFVNILVLRRKNKNVNKRNQITRNIQVKALSFTTN